MGIIIGKEYIMNPPFEEGVATKGEKTKIIEKADENTKAKIEVLFSHHAKRKMKKIAELDYASEYSMAHMWGKLNRVIQALNDLKCVEEEAPIYETLSHNDALIISKSDKGVLVARNHLGDVELKRVKYPKEEEEK